MRYATGQYATDRYTTNRYATDRHDINERSCLVYFFFALYIICRQVPWKTFASGRASLHISGVTLVLEPLGSANYEDEIERALRHAIFAKKQVWYCGTMITIMNMYSCRYNSEME